MQPLQQSQILPNNMALQQQNKIKKQQKILHLNNLIQTFSDPSIKNLQSHNKNKIQRQLLDIASNFHSLVQKLEMMKVFCIDYKKTLQTYRRQQRQLQRKEKARLQHQRIDQEKDDLNFFTAKGSSKKIIDEKQEKQRDLIPFIFDKNKPNSMNAQNPNYLQGQQKPQQDLKPMIVLPARRLQTQKRQLQQTINKLKVMVVKVNTKQSTSLQHVYSTYISRLKYTLQNSNLDEKRFKMHKIKKIFNYLPKKYIILKLESKGIYPYHQTRYPNYIPYHYSESPMFFINFYTQQLLFVNFLPLTLPKQNFSQILYCPIILVRQKGQQCLKISPWYLQQLSSVQPLWRSSILIIKVYSSQTSLSHPVYYSHISLKRFQLPSQLISEMQSKTHGFNFMKHQYANEQQLLSDLQKIKIYIYQALIFNHLHKLLVKKGNKKYDTENINPRVYIQGGFIVEFDLVCDLEFRQKSINKLYPLRAKSNTNAEVSEFFDNIQTNDFPQPLYKAQLITDLLIFYKKKNLFTLKKSVLTQQLEIMIKTSLFKVITEHIEYRTVTPAYPGSLGKYYYQKKSIRKQNVNSFLQKF